MTGYSKCKKCGAVVYVKYNKYYCGKCKELFEIKTKEKLNEKK